MAKKLTVKLGSKKMTVNLNRTKVANAVEALIKACVTPEFPIGMTLQHANGDEYVLARIKQHYGGYRAYLINTSTGIARNSRKVVMVQEADAGLEDAPKGYVEDLPAERDRFYDPDGSGNFIDC